LLRAVQASPDHLGKRSDDLVAGRKAAPIVTFVREIRGARSIWIQEVREAESRRTLVSAQVTGAFATEDGRPARAPDSFREKLSALLVPDGTVAPSQ